MFGIGLVRNWFRRKLAGSLESSLKDGFFIPDPEQQKEPALAKMSFEVNRRHLLGLIPIFNVRKIGSITISDLVTSLLHAVRTTFVNELRQIPGKVSGLVGGELKGQTEKRISMIKTNTSKKIEGLTQAFNKEQLGKLIKGDRNVFRQRLLEELGKQSAHVFADMTKQRLAELVMRARQEVIPDDLVPSYDDRTTLVALPTGTRFFTKRGKMTVFVIEQSPQTRTLKIMDDKGDKSEMYQLSFPHIVFFVTLRGRRSDKMYVFFRKGPLRDTKDELLCPALPNIHDDFSVCFSPSGAKSTQAEMAEESISSFLGGRFIRTEIRPNLTSQIDLGKWEAETKRNALFGSSYNWRRAQLTVAEMLDKISTDFVSESTKPQDKGGKNILSALDVAVNNMTTTITNRMKEVCFKLVPEWNMDEIVLSEVSTRFDGMIAELGAFVRSEVGKEIDSILGEKSMHEAFDIGIKRTTESLDNVAQRPMAIAHETFLAKLKEV